MSKFKTKVIDFLTPDDYLEWHKTCFKWMGIIPTYWNKYNLPIIIVHYTLCTFVLLGLEITDLIMNLGLDLKETLKNWGLINLHGFLAYRFFTWFLLYKDFLEYINRMKRPSFEFSIFNYDCLNYDLVRELKRSYSNADYETLRLIWKKQNILIKSKEKINVVEEYQKRIMKLARFLGVMLLSAYISGSLIDTILTGFGNTEYEEFNPKKNKISVFRNYSFGIYLPIDWSLSDGYYWHIYFYLKYSMGCLSFTYIAIDSFYIASLAYLIAQIKVIKFAFKNVDQNLGSAQEKDSVILIKKIRIVQCISELQEIFGAIEFLERTHNRVLLLEYGFMVTVLCSIIYSIPLVETIVEICCLSAMVLLVTIEPFMVCLVGQLLTDELLSVANTVYLDLDWCSYPNELRRTLVFLIRRCQKPIVLTFGKMFNIQLLFFVQLMKACYSFYTLIQSSTSK